MITRFYQVITRVIQPTKRYYRGTGCVMIIKTIQHWLQQPLNIDATNAVEMRVSGKMFTSFIFHSFACINESGEDKPVIHVICECLKYNHFRFQTQAVMLWHHPKWTRTGSWRRQEDWRDDLNDDKGNSHSLIIEMTEITYNEMRRGRSLLFKVDEVFAPRYLVWAQQCTSGMAADFFSIALLAYPFEKFGRS